MAGKPKTESANHLRAWREYREMTQAELADLVGTSHNVISQLESGARGLSDKWLRRLAPALGTTAGRLCDFDPEDLEGELFQATVEVPPERREEAAQVLRIMFRQNQPAPPHAGFAEPGPGKWGDEPKADGGKRRR